MYGIAVHYQNSQDYRVWGYLVDDKIVLERGDLVIVPVLDIHVFKVAKVLNIIQEPILKNDIYYRWVAQKLDLTNYNKWLCRSNDEGGIKDYHIEENLNGTTNSTT